MVRDPSIVSPSLAGVLIAPRTTEPESRVGAPGTGSALAGVETCRAVSYREGGAAEAQSTET